MTASDRSIAARVPLATVLGGKFTRLSHYRREMLGGLLLLTPALLILLGLVV